MSGEPRDPPAPPAPPAPPSDPPRAGGDAVARVLVDDRGAVRVVRWSNPAKRNALTRALLERVVAALPAGPPSPAQPIRALVLAGDPAGGGFSAGFDLDALAGEERDAARASLPDRLDPIDGPARALEASPVPVIAAIEGMAWGGALEVACACDLRVAARPARLAMPPARLGLGYALPGLARFVRLVGRGGALALFLDGEPIGAEEALRLGLVERVCEAGRALDEAVAWAEAIARSAPLAVLAMRRAVHALADPLRLGEGERAHLADLRARTLASADLDEGLRAIRERRSPRFEGL